ncbi:hypothetical protein HDV02_000982 [Globomyces sp. JEL0801]|nr:hypothetical protein HDV02_000982 [Globomyces sp. JEL0801]
MNDTSNHTVPLNVTHHSLYEDLTGFAVQLINDPLHTLLSHPAVVASTLILISLPFILSWAFPSLKKKKSNSLHSLLGDIDSYRDAVLEASPVDTLWEIGTSKQTASIQEDGVLRAIEFTKDALIPTPEHCVITLLKSIIDPIDPESSVISKPKVLLFLETFILTNEQKSEIKELLKEFDIDCVEVDELSQKYPQLLEQRLAFVAPPNPVESFQLPTEQAPGEPIKPNSPPPRGCFACKKEILGKASQCAACKAVIYCSPECAKAGWPTHKMQCADFKATMSHISDWNLHDFPFTYYNKDNILNNYNVVPFLDSKKRHNVGLFARLCGCFNQLPWGAISAHLIQRFRTQQADPQTMFKSLGLPQEMFPLSAPFPADVDVTEIDSWKALYTAKKYSFDNPAALILDTPMTVWHCINQFILKRSEPLKEGERRRITIHLIGVEREADLLPLFEILLAFLPKTDLCIHMIGPNISGAIPPELRAMILRSVANDSTLFISLNSVPYQAEHISGQAFQLPDSVPAEVKASQNFGESPPDLIIALNAELVAHQEWAETAAAIIQSQRKFVMTERIEQLCSATCANISRVGGKVTLPPHCNPFRQPVYEFKKDVNLPGWSNAYLLGLGNFDE